MLPLSNTQTQEAEPLLFVAQGIKKSFGKTAALAGADFQLAPGEIHGLLGANGAGKSTLSKVISGHHTVDGGSLSFRGQELQLRNTRDALTRGIAIVMQETSLVPDLTVLENIFLPELAAPGRLDYAALRRRGQVILEALGQDGTLPFDREVRKLSSAQKQLVEIAKALSLNADLIIFDEPTASLSPGEVERLFDVMSRLRASGKGLIFVSHRLEEVFAITDRVTVMREGRTIMMARETSSLSQADLIRAMVGSEVGSIYERTTPVPVEDAPVVLNVEHLSSLPEVRDVSFSVRKGEIVGLGGLVGAGRSEAVEAIFGLRSREGVITLSGQSLKPNNPAASIRSGIGLVAEDRRTQNIVPDLTVKENLLLAHLGASKGFLCNYRSREAAIKEICAQLDLPASRLVDASMLNFSGGMQQKIIMARWLLLEPSLLILDEPTKGVDIQTRATIYAMLRAIAARGVALVVVSSDFKELLGFSDRIVVISDGRSVADLPSQMLDEEKLTLLAAPRTSMAKNTEMLRGLAGELNGAGFWFLREGDGLICLNSAISNQGVAPGFGAGEAISFDKTFIPRALSQRDEGFVDEPENGRTSLIVPMTSPRGHDLGWVGISIPTTAVRPDPDAVRARIHTLAASL